jgi:hypothetical protein
MVTRLEHRLEAWLRATPDIRAAVVFGSAARTDTPLDALSDVDIQLVTTRPRRYRLPDAYAGIDPALPGVVGAQPASGGVTKVTVLFADGLADLIIIPWHVMTAARLAFATGLWRLIPPALNGLKEFCSVQRAGHRVVKGGAGWARFVASAIREVPRLALTDDDCANLAAVAHVECLFAIQKARRGECIAARRALVRNASEAGFKLAFEGHARRGLPARREGRRLESWADPQTREALALPMGDDPEALCRAARAIAAECVRLAEAMTGRRLVFPPLP